MKRSCKNTHGYQSSPKQYAAGVVKSLSVISHNVKGDEFVILTHTPPLEENDNKKGKLLLQTSLYLKETLSKNEKFTALSFSSPLYGRKVKYRYWLLPNLTLSVLLLKMIRVKHFFSQETYITLSLPDRLTLLGRLI